MKHFTIQQEEHGWCRDKEMIKALSLTRYGVQYTHTTIYPGGGVRVVWELPVSSIAGVALVSSGIGLRITLHSSVLYANKQEHVPVNRRKGKPLICDAEAMSEVCMCTLLYDTCMYCIPRKYAAKHTAYMHINMWSAVDMSVSV
jgi:hypothetical protein